jgi:hypothetical protein
MFVERILSLNNGWSILTTQKSEEWAEAQAALYLIDDDFIMRGAKAATDEHLKGAFIPYYLYNMYNNYLASAYSWTDTLPKAKTSVKSHMHPKATKNGVSASIVEGNIANTEDFLTNLYITIPFYYQSGAIEISILLIPTADAINHIIKLGVKPSYVAHIPTEEDCRAEFNKFSSLTSQTPIVLAFFSPSAPEEIIVDEVIPLKVGEHTIERTIEFAPEFYQAGVGLLSYFGEVLRQKDPNTKAKVRIEQEGNTVRLHIVPPVGEAEVVEKQLEQFALIINGQSPPDLLLDNPGQIVQLKAQLRVAQMQIENAYDLKQLTTGKHAQDIQNLEHKIDALTQQIANRVLDQGSSYEVL